MNVRYQVSGAAHSFGTTENEDLRTILQEVEDHLRTAHPELSDRPYLAERVADSVLNSLASDAEIDLGDLS